MKRSISKVALAVALSVGMVGAVGFSDPAFAVQKKKDKGEAKAQYSEEFVAAYQALNTKAEAEGAVGATLAADVPGLIAVTSSPDEKMATGGLVQRIGIMAQDTKMQQQGIDLMIESGKVSAEQRPLVNFVGGQLALVNKQPARAVPLLQQAIDLGYNENNVGYLLGRALIDNGQKAEGLAQFDRVVAAKQAAGQPVPEGLAFDALAAAVADQDRENGFKWAMLALETDSREQVRGQAYKILAAYSPFTDLEQLDLLRLMYRDAGLTESRQYVEYISLMNPLRRPGEAKVLLDSYDGWPAGNSMVADARTAAADRYASVRKELAVDSKGATGEDALNIGDVYLGYGDSVEAEAMYRAALSTNAADARALTGLGIALADQGKYAEAKDTFSQISAGNRSLLAKAWIAYINLQLGSDA